MQPKPTLRSQNAIAGVAILLLSLSVLSVLDASGKWLLTAGVSLLLVIWFRYVVHFVLIVGLLISRRELHLFRSVSLKYQILRGTTILFTTMGFFYDAVVFASGTSHDHDLSGAPDHLGARSVASRRT